MFAQSLLKCSNAGKARWQLVSEKQIRLKGLDFSRFPISMESRAVDIPRQGVRIAMIDIDLQNQKQLDRSTKRNEQFQRQPNYSVVVHNDELHTFAYVIEVLQKVCGLSEGNAFQLTQNIHYLGKAHVWSGSKEVAEFKRDRIRGFGPDFYASNAVRFPLGVTLEPLPVS